ncbi:MAG: hypothetical protein GY754_44255 [bacterium]|nr:hypothetical protein [bacterium]
MQWPLRDFVTDMTKFSYMIELKYIEAHALNQDSSAVEKTFVKKIIIMMSASKLERLETVIYNFALNLLDSLS